LQFTHPFSYDPFPLFSIIVNWYKIQQVESLAGMYVTFNWCFNLLNSIFVTVFVHFTLITPINCPACIVNNIKLVFSGEHDELTKFLPMTCCWWLPCIITGNNKQTIWLTFFSLCLFSWKTIEIIVRFYHRITRRKFMELKVLDYGARFQKMSYTVRAEAIALILKLESPFKETWMPKVERISKVYNLTCFKKPQSYYEFSCFKVTIIC
jgi:hypothetical protein